MSRAGGKILAVCILLFKFKFSFKFIRKIDEIQNIMYHYSQLATASRGEQWLDVLNKLLPYNAK